ncbi:MAG: TolC family protein [Desulfomonile tiedjei]|nr:TolC family protein [Desulfomonile tiedjei]
MAQSRAAERSAFLLILCLVLMVLSSCRFPSMVAFSADNHRQLVHAHAADALMNHRVKPVSAATGKRVLTLEDCRAMALSNSLELQAGRLDELTQRAIRYSNMTRMLPHFLYSGDLSQRDNIRYSYSEVLGLEGSAPNPLTPGTGVTSFSTGHERSTWVQIMEARWSATDAALAYYVSKSSGNDRLKAYYRRVRTSQKILEAVDGAFYRLLALQECLPLAQGLMAIRKGTRGKFEELLKEKLARIEDVHRGEEKTIRATRLFARLQADMAAQRDLLATAMAISPDACIDGGFCVSGVLLVPPCAPQICTLEMTAVQNRPEAFEAGLTHLNASNDVRRTIVKTFPRTSGFWRHTRDKDKFMYDKEWKEVGVSIYFDLIDWVANLQELGAARTTAAKTEREMGAVALAITSQVRQSAIKFVDSLEEVRAAQASLASFGRLYDSLEKRLSVQDLDKLSVEEARGDLLEGKINRLKAMAEANAASAVLESAMGTNYREPIPAD